MPTPVWIGLGSNLGDREAILQAALTALAGVAGVDLVAVSSFHETKPIGGPPGQGPFLNAAAHLETTLNPQELLAILQRIENQAGRVRIVRWGERTLDLDILIFGTKFLDNKELKLPHPRLAFRRFVLAPLAEIAPTVVDTMTKRTMADLLANLDRKPRLLALEGSPGQLKEMVFRQLVEELPGFGIAEADLSGNPVNDLDPFSQSIETIERKIQTLRSSFWANETLRVPWIVSDFSLGFDLQRAFSTNCWQSLAQVDRDPRKLLDHKKRLHMLEVATTTVPPTLVLILPSTETRQRRPGLSKTPQLRPESDKPDAIVAEVLATCRGIDEG